jgi:hypothetical protein
MACTATMVLICGCGGVTKTEAGSAGASGSTSSSAGAGYGGSTSVGDAVTGGTAGAGGEAGVLADISGTWKGYVENYSFRDKSDAITLRIVSGPNGITGHATFGMSPQPPPVTNPTVGYPPGFGYPPEFEPDLTSPYPGFASPYPGFAFTIEEASLGGSRLQFDISTGEMWKTWCEAQVPIASPIAGGTNAGSYSYGCTRNWATNYGATCAQLDPMTMDWIPLDCGTARLCAPGSVCQCTAKACGVILRGGIHFDVNVTLPKADGSVSGLDTNLHNIYLTKG